MKILILLMAMTLTAPAQAGVFKCQTPDGIKYSEQPCPAGSTSASIRPVSVADQPQSSSSPAPKSKASVSNITAVPLPAPDKQRGAYESFLTRPNPRAFVICSDGRVQSLFGDKAFIKSRLAKLDSGCRPYAIDDSVVW